jgi:acyl-CoA reductase-like NAD-dependent aldehyde dehydrogenase
VTSTALPLAAGSRPDELPTDDHYARNLIGRLWRFPAAPYEFEIRSPSDSTVTALVPLSSRFDVAAAVEAAGDALRGPWADPATRPPLLRALVDRISACQQQLASLQATETGLSLPDSRAAVGMTLRIADALLRGAGRNHPPMAGGVSGHILSWGLPLTEVVTSVLPALIRGDTAVIKPSLRGALSPVAFAFLAAEVGLPPGVVNLVQGTGGDVGAELISRRDLSALHVRAGERTISQAERAHQRTGVPLHTLRAGGNAAIVGPDALADLAQIARTVATAVRMHSAGGPLGLPLLVVHRDIAEPVLAAVAGMLSTTVPAPLPAEPLRRRAIDGIERLIAAGAQIQLGGPHLPDDVPHRMGWRMPPTILRLGSPGSPAAVVEQAQVPLGPILCAVTVDRWDALATAFPAHRAVDGIARVWGIGTVASLPHGLVDTDASPRDLLTDSTLPAAWVSGAR